MSLLHQSQGRKSDLQSYCLGNRIYYGGQATVASVSSNDITVNAPSIVGVPGAQHPTYFSPTNR